MLGFTWFLLLYELCWLGCVVVLNLGCTLESLGALRTYRCWTFSLESLVYCFELGSRKGFSFHSSSCDSDDQKELRTIELDNRVDRTQALEAALHVLIVTEWLMMMTFHGLPCWRHFWSEQWALGSSGCWWKHCWQVASAQLYEADPGAEGQPLSDFLLQLIKINHVSKYFTINYLSGIRWRDKHVTSGRTIKKLFLIL